jgi:hypothetical protein
MKIYLGTAWCAPSYTPTLLRRVEEAGDERVRRVSQALKGLLTVAVVREAETSQSGGRVKRYVQRG